MTPEQTTLLLSATTALVGTVAAVVSALAAVVAVREQRRTQRPQIRIRQGLTALTHGRPGEPGASVDDEPWFGITISNTGIVPVTIASVSIILEHGAAPFFGSTSGMGDELPKRLEAGEAARILFDELRTVARTHATPGQGPARHVNVTLAGGQEFNGPPIDRGWLDGWARPAR